MMTLAVTVDEVAICRIMENTMYEKKRIFAVLVIPRIILRFNTVDNHSIIIEMTER